MYKIKRFFNRFYNLYRWLPVIWKDQDWDHWYIYEIIKFKLKNQSAYIHKHDRHLSAKREAEIMMLCVNLIDKLQSEYYTDEPHKYYKSTIVFKYSAEHEGWVEIDSKQQSENLDDYFNKYSRIYKKVVTSKKRLPFKKNDKQGIAFNIGRINHNRAKKLLYKIMHRHLERWWD